MSLIVSRLCFLSVTYFELTGINVTISNRRYLMIRL